MKMKFLTKMLTSLGLISYVNLYSQRTYDAALLLRATGTVVATDTGTIIVDTGGQAMIDAECILDVSAVKASVGDEFYQFVIQGSPDATFGTAANISVLATQRVGGATGAAPLGTADVAGRYLVPFRNERNGVTFRYIRLQVILGGTAPSLTYVAWIAKDG